MRVLFAPKEVAGQISVLSHALRDLGIPAKSLVFVPHKFGYHIDRTIVLGNYPNFSQRVLRLLVLLSSLFAFDVFHFQYGKTLFLSSRDLSILKLFKKKILMHFHGSEIRNPQYLIAKGESSSVVPSIMTSEQTSKLNFFRKYIDRFIVSTPDLLELVPKAIYLPNSVGEEWFSHRKPTKEDDEFVVVHAPTSRAVKGTEFVISACANLKKRGYNIELKLVENVSNREIRELYEQADVFVDQLLIGWYGVAAIENMALGNPVISYIKPELNKKYAPDLPIIQANKDNIEEVLESLLGDRKILVKIGTASKEYAKKNHYPKINAGKLIDIYNSI